MKHVIEVTADDISRAVDLAEERNAGDGPPLAVSCPIALAAMRALQAERVETVPDYQDSSVWDLLVSNPVTDVRSLRSFVLPQEAVDFIERFDDARMVQPFTFTVEGGE